MSDNKEVVIKVELPQIVNETLKPLASSIGNTLSHGWQGMTVSIETWYGRKMIDRDQNLKLYKENIEKDLSNISEENLQEPKMNILGPVFDASTYYFEEEQYRIMFSKLIASSCDKSKNSVVHPAFVEFIKQMTPLEGKILSTLDLEKPLLINIIDTSESSNKHYAYCPAITDFFGANPLELNTALNNLERLGLISLPSEFTLIEATDDSDNFIHSDKFIDIEYKLNQLIDFNHEYIIFPMSITNLGLNFIKVCIE